METSKTKSTAPGLAKDRPLVIGYLTPFISGGVNSPRWRGVIDAARECGMSLVSFSGRYYQGRGSPQEPANALYGLVSAETLDGVLVGNIMQENLCPPAEIESFYEQLGMPVVNLRESMRSMPYVPLDNYRAMYEAVLHLIQVHQRRRIAFLRGPEGHPYAEERFQAYVDALRQGGLSVDPNRVTPPSDWRVSGARVLLEERGLRPGVDFDAVVGVNDDKALDAIAMLLQRGVRVPGEVAVTGFNDQEQARAVTPTLTTVRLPFYEQGRQALHILAALLAGQPAPEEVVLPVHLIVRESCGCVDPVVSQAAVGPLPAERGQSREDLLAQRQRITAAVIQSVEATVEHLDAAWVGSLLDSVIAELDGGSSGAFLTELNDVLQQLGETSAALAEPERNVAAWNQVISSLRRQAMPYLLGEPAALLQAEDLWQQARIVIAKHVERLKVMYDLRDAQREQALRELGTQMGATFNLMNLLNVLAERLPGLGIPACYLSLYESPGRDQDSLLVPPWSRLVMAYDENRRWDLPDDGLRFPSHHLIPEELSPWQQLRSFVVEPLYLEHEQMGFVLFQVGPRQADIYEVLRGEIVNAIQGARLVEQVEQRALLLQTAAGVANVISSILNLEELCQQVVDLLGERFGLYHAGIFLMSSDGEPTGEAGRWVVMQAGGGEAGRQVAAQDLRIEVDGNSMVGWCASQGRARLAARVDADPIYRAHPLLSETRSELALPLRVGERVTGVLDVQSRYEDVFDESYQQVLQTVADQLAVAVENARAMEGMRQLNLDIERTLQTQRVLLETVQALSTPVMPLLEGVVLLPLVGHIDSRRAQRIMEGLLEGAQRYRAQMAIVDITGVVMVDTAVASSLLQAAHAVRLLGAEVVLVGIRPEVAQTIVGLGVDFTGLVTVSDLQSGIEYALQHLRTGALFPGRTDQ